MRRFFFLILLVAITTGNLFGQSSKVVQGTMVDEKTKREIKNVHIVIKNVETKDSFATKTNSDGYFKFVNVPFGTYEFKVQDREYTRDGSFNFEINEDHADSFTFGQPITAVLKVSWMFN